MTTESKRSWLWIFISIFIVIWIGDQLIGALLEKRIINLRSAEYILYDSEPKWFVFVVTYRALLFIGCFVYLLITLFNVDIIGLLSKRRNRS